MARSLCRLSLALLALVLLPFTLAGQAYSRIVVFGDSLSDAGNVARLTQTRYGVRVPGPAAGYTDGRFTSGADTLPATSLYTGVWVEQLAASLPARPAVKASLDGGTDYAYGSATTANGTTTDMYGSFSVTVNNLGQQVADYLATKPTIDGSTLFIVWAGANDLLNAQSSAQIAAAANNEIALLQKLMAAGATEIIVPNLPSLGATPRLNGNAMAAAQASAAAQAYNTGLFAGVQQLAASAKNVHFYPLDTYALFSSIVAAPAQSQLDNAKDVSQFKSVMADRYLFWDDIHPTTTGHHLLAVAALKLITPVPILTATTLSSSATTSNLNGTITLTATVTAQSGSSAPTGTVTFVDMSTTLGTATLTASGTTTATATLQVSTLAAGSHMLMALYSGASTPAFFASSNSPTLLQTVVAPTISTAASPTSLTISRGSTGTTTLTATPAGGYSGTVTFACGTLPANMTCLFSPASLTLPGNNTAQTSTLTIGTQGMAALHNPFVPGPFTAPGLREGATAVCCLFLVGGMARRRKVLANRMLLGLFAMLTLTAAAGLSGCGGTDRRTPAGTYTVPVNVTAGASSSTINLQVTVQ